MQKLIQLKQRGFQMLTGFLAVFIILFMPIFPGADGQKGNGLNYLDNFFNQLSKGSAYYIDNLLEEAGKYAGVGYSAELKMRSAHLADRVQGMLAANNLMAVSKDQSVKVTGDFGAIMTAILQDADLMYRNDGESITAKYGQNERVVLHDWYQALMLIEKDLNKAGKFADAKFVKKSITKAVEPAYNYYMVEMKPVKEGMALLILSLVFYVIYTVWYGFGLLYIFEGLGIKLTH